MKSIILSIALLSVSVSSMAAPVFNEYDSRKFYEATKNMPVHGNYSRKFLSSGGTVTITATGSRTTRGIPCKSYSLSRNGKVFDSGTACRIDPHNWFFGDTR